MTDLTRFFRLMALALPILPGLSGCMVLPPQLPPESVETLQIPATKGRGNPDLIEMGGKVRPAVPQPLPPK